MYHAMPKLQIKCQMAMKPFNFSINRQIFQSFNEKYAQITEKHQIPILTSEPEINSIEAKFSLN